MSERGVVLFHDITVYKEGFGVWKLWGELKEKFPHFELTHGYGLGLLAVGEETPPKLNYLLNSSETSKQSLQRFFEYLETKIQYQNPTNDTREEVADKETKIQALLGMVTDQEHDLELLLSGLADGDLLLELSDKLDHEERAIQSLEMELLEIKNSTAWSLIQWLWRLRVKLFPHQSTQEKIIQWLLRLVRMVGGGKGLKTSSGQQAQNGFTSQIRPLLGGGRKRLGGSDSTLEFGENFEDGKKQALAWGNDYLDLKEAVSMEKKRQRSQIGFQVPALISYPPEQLDEVARNFNLSHRKEPLVSIIIPVRNHLKLTLECIASIQSCTSNISYEIIVIDDLSNDKTADLLPIIGNLRYIRNEENLGYLLSCNKASQSARGEFLLFLNNDVQVTKGWLEELLGSFQKHQDVGIVGPKILFPDGRLQEAGAALNSDGTTELIGLFDDPTLPRYNYDREIDYCSGVCMLMRQRDFNEVGGYDEAFIPAYCEDVDICFRFRELGKSILYNPNAVIIHHLSATTDQLGKTYKQILVNENSQKIMERWGNEIEKRGETRVISFYLPQYHPIPENDRWWGKGFTDWINVANSHPNYRGHYQPHLPSDLGFYDLRVKEVLEDQAQLAKRYGIHGFCFYYYWFGGKTLLDFPLRGLLDTGKPDIPFCLCWANENWTRTWDGHDEQVLISQVHSEQDDLAFIKNIAPYLKNSNYIRINAKPLLLIYRVDLLPDVLRTAELWRNYCLDQGIGEIYLAMMQTFQHARSPAQSHPTTFGFDAAVEFPPHPFNDSVINPPGQFINPDFGGSIHDYRQTALKYLKAETPDFVRFRGVMPSWDNTPRRQDQGTIYRNSSPGYYQAWLEAVLDFTREQYFGDERIVFINAWNEWAEGAHLEPDLRFGHGYLEATQNAIYRGMLERNQS
jgi:GT2 family glycosyltransferase